MLIDAHAHLDRYSEELPSVLEEIRRHRIFTISNSMDPRSYERNAAIGQKCELVLPTFGVHPWHAHLFADRLEELKRLLGQSPLIGEIGLDHYYVRDTDQHESQRTVFDFFLSSARDMNKIVILHTKGAEEEVYDLLTKHQVRRAIVHWYSGSRETLKKYTASGYYVTIGVEITSSEEIRRIATEIPDELLLTETDNPGGAVSLTGGPGMPRLLLGVVEALAETRGVTPGEIERTVQANLTRLIGDDQNVPEPKRRLLEEEVCGGGTHR